MTTALSSTLEQTADTAFEYTKEALSRYSFDSNEVYYTFADKTIVPTFLTRPVSRKSVDTHQTFRTLKGQDLNIFPAFGASMAFMRSRFARDVFAASEDGVAGGVHILPRVGLSDKERLADVVASKDAQVGVALGIHEDETWLEQLLSQTNLAFVSIDIAHGANAAALSVLEKLRALGVNEGVILGNVGSVEGFLYAYYLMKLSGFKSIIIKVGVGPGSVCTTRINTGVGVGQFTLLEQIARVRQELQLSDVTIISDGGVNAAGDFVKALAFSDGVMMGKFFASGSFEDSVLMTEGGKLIGVHLYGMASAMVTEKRNFIEGSSQTLKSFHKNAQEAVKRLREGLQSAMTYVNAMDLNEFRSNVRFATNSHAAIVEGGVH
jgi:IMP dehydrogenase